MLAFDTYSSNIHYYSVPSSAYYQAKGGDFEFKLVEWSDDGIVMKGLRNSKTIRLYPLDEDASGYISKIREASDNFIVSIIDGTVGTTEVTGDIDLNYRQLTLNWEDADSTAYSVTVPFVTTLTGLHLYEPVEVAGETLEYLDFDTVTGKFSTEAYGAVTDLTGRMPEDYVPYDDFAGTYTLNYWNNTGKATVTLTPGVEDETYIMSGLSKYYTVTLNYVKTTGRLSLNSQKIGQTDDGSSIWFCAWNAYSGRLSWNTAAGVQTVWNLDSEHPVYTFESNNYDFLEGANSFIFWLVDADGYSAGQYTATGLDPYNRSMFPFLNNLTKN